VSFAATITSRTFTSPDLGLLVVVFFPRVEAILHDLWDEPRRTVLMGWDVPARHRPFKVTMKYHARPGPLYRSAPTPVEIFVVIYPRTRDNPVFLVAAKAVAESKNYNMDWSFCNPFMSSGISIIDDEMVEMSMREWIVTAWIRDTTVPGISDTRPMACINFNIRRRGDSLII
jgi:hypothetical protein